MPSCEPIICPLKVVLQGISPMIWRRPMVCGDSTIADLQHIVQIAMGWSDDHLHHQLKRIKWFLWHGNTFSALQTVSWLHMDIDADESSKKQNKLLKKLEEFETYIRTCAGFITNYGERWRYGDSICTAFMVIDRLNCFLPLFPVTHQHCHAFSWARNPQRNMGDYRNFSYRLYIFFPPLAQKYFCRTTLAPFILAAFPVSICI